MKSVVEGEKALRIGSGGVVCLANDLLPVDAKNWYIPVGLIIKKQTAVKWQSVFL